MTQERIMFSNPTPSELRLSPAATIGGGEDMMDDDETPSGKRDTGQAPTVTEEPRSQRRCKQSQMVETEPDTILIDQNEACNQLSNDRIDVSRKGG